MIAETSATIGGIKAAMDMAKGVISLKTATEINQAIIDIQSKLLEAQSSAFDDKERISNLTQRIRELEKALTSKDDWAAQKARYVLTESPLGAFSYNLKDPIDGEPFHRLCVKCAEDGFKSVLHTITKHSGGEIVRCERCQSNLKLADFIHR